MPEPKSALSGELGLFAAPEGRTSSEISITVIDPRLNRGRPTNIPTLVQGQEDPQAIVDSGGRTISSMQQEIAIRRAVERVKRGQELPSFKSLEEAVAAAIARSESKTDSINR